MSESHQVAECPETDKTKKMPSAAKVTSQQMRKTQIKKHSKADQ